MYTCGGYEELGCLEGYRELGIDSDQLGKTISQDWYCVSLLAQEAIIYISKAFES